MKTFAGFLERIDNPSHRNRLEEVFDWIKNKYPNLKEEIKWNQPMYTDHGTYIIGFSVSKKHMSVAPESVTIRHVEEDIKKAGYDYTKEIIRIPWDQEVDFNLLEKMIEYNMVDKADCTTFWR